MRIFQVLPVALRAAWMVLRQNRWRSLLTLTICSLGTAGVILAGVLGQANVAQMQTRLRTLGGGMIVVSPGTVTPYPGRQRQLEHHISLEPEDGAALMQRVPAIQRAVPVVARGSTIRNAWAAVRVRLIGTTPDYFQLRGFNVERGRSPHAKDDGKRVIVLGHAISSELATDGVQPGDIVSLGGQPYEVIGTLPPLGVNFAGEDEDHQVFIPLETYRWRVANRPWIGSIYLQLSPKADTKAAIRDVQSLLRDRHGRWGDQTEDAVVKDFAELAAQQSGLLNTVVGAVSIVGGLLLLLGIVGIGTLMMLVVRQRHGEIGLRRAVGATPTDILIQFLIEGLLIASTGVLAGVGIGIAGSFAVGHVLAAPVSFDIPLLLLASGVSLLAASLACFIPAMLAARLEPAVALRS